MKVIDLLNKIKNEEYVPKKLKYKGDIFKVRGNNYYLVSSNRYLFNETNILTMLNDEIEIIEDTPESKPITKKDLETLGYAFGEMTKAFQNGWNKSLNNKPFKEGK